MQKLTKMQDITSFVTQILTLGSTYGYLITFPSDIQEPWSNTATVPPTVPYSPTQISGNTFRNIFRKMTTTIYKKLGGLIDMTWQPGQTAYDKWADEQNGYAVLYDLLYYVTPSLNDKAQPPCPPRWNEHHDIFQFGAAWIKYCKHRLAHGTLQTDELPEEEVFNLFLHDLPTEECNEGKSEVTRQVHDWQAGVRKQNSQEMSRFNQKQTGKRLNYS